MPENPKRNSVTPALSYKDPTAALVWLEKAFGFEPSMVVTDDKGAIGHAEMTFGDGAFMFGGEWSEQHRSPASLDGKNTQSVHVQLSEGLEAHCEQARKAGADIIQEPQEQFYGDRTYRARDLEGHVWTFGQTVRTVGVAEMEKASGLKIRMRV